MAWKQFKKRVIEILIDDSSSFLTDEECEKWKEQRKERIELESERKRQERQLLDTWFEQEEIHQGQSVETAVATACLQYKILMEKVDCRTS